MWNCERTNDLVCLFLLLLSSDVLYEFVLSVLNLYLLMECWYASIAWLPFFGKKKEDEILRDLTRRERTSRPYYRLRINHISPSVLLSVIKYYYWCCSLLNLIVFTKCNMESCFHSRVLFTFSIRSIPIVTISLVYCVHWPSLKRVKSRPEKECAIKKRKFKYALSN